jgi:hypothetical protein
MNVAIVCEGKSDKEFFEKLIKHLDEKNKIPNLKTTTLNFYIFGGKSKVFDINHKKYEELKLETERTKKILFVVDADNEINDILNNGFENTQQGLNKIIAELEFQEVISSTYIMCDPETKEGYLESLILSTIDPEQRNCIECFLNCSQFESKENHKAILNKIYNMAYPNAPYDFSHQHFDELKTKLTQLFVE